MYEFFIINAKGCKPCTKFMTDHEQNVRTLLNQHFPDITFKIFEKPDVNSLNWGDIPEYIIPYIRYFPKFMIFNGKELIYSCKGFDVEQNIEKIKGFVSKPTIHTTPTTQNE
jgi:hypothetical protein